MENATFLNLRSRLDRVAGRDRFATNLRRSLRAAIEIIHSGARLEAIQHDCMWDYAIVHIYTPANEHFVVNTRGVCNCGAADCAHVRISESVANVLKSEMLQDRYSPEFFLQV